MTNAARIERCTNIRPPFFCHIFFFFFSPRVISQTLVLLRVISPTLVLPIVILPTLVLLRIIFFFFFWPTLVLPRVTLPAQ